MTSIEKQLRAAVLNLKPILDWMYPLVNGRSDQWKGDRLKQAIAIAELPANWDELNYRRIQLIEEKLNDGKLSEAKEKELSVLQEIAGKVRDAFTPELPRTRITMSMPIDGMLRLQQKYQEDPEAVKKHFADQGFDIEQILFPPNSELLPSVVDVKGVR